KTRKVELIEAAAWSTDTKLHFQMGTEFNAGKVDTDCQPTSVEVQAFAVSSLIKRLKAPGIVLVKMHMEGAEEAILRADPSWLSAVRAIAIETHNPAFNPELDGILADHGLTVVHADTHTRLALRKRPAAQSSVVLRRDEIDGRAG